MKIEDLYSKVEGFKKSLETIEEKRKSWQDYTRPLLIKTFNQIIEKYPIGWHLQIFEQVDNWESINLNFGSKPTGLQEIKDGTGIHHTKRGGAIAYSQSYHGDVYIVIFYPYIEKFVEEKDREIIGPFHPESLTEEIIIEKVSYFLDEMAKWEANKAISIPLGFRRNTKLN